MEAASHEAKRMDCTELKVKPTRAMDPSNWIRAVRLAAQWNRRAHRSDNPSKPTEARL